MKLIEYQGEVLLGYVPNLPRTTEDMAKCCVLFDFIGSVKKDKNCEIS